MGSGNHVKKLPVGNGRGSNYPHHCLGGGILYTYEVGGVP
jgi:hypothetical protein